MRLSALFAGLVLFVVPNGAAAAAAPTLLIPPVDGSISRRFEPPPSDYGPGHRGLDYSVAPSTRVRAAGAGVVAFAGRVAGSLAVTVDHGGGLETTYSLLSELYVTAGERIGQGRFVGATAAAHRADASGLHFGVKLHDRYVDPLEYLGPVDVAGAIHLVPVVDIAGRTSPGATTRDGVGPAAARQPCRPPDTLRHAAVAPNDNIAVAVAGVNSSTSGATPDIYSRTFGPRALGYPSERVYEFSYRGLRGIRLHRPYGPKNTWSGLRRAATRLHALLARIARRHPGADVDVLAHSQGGIVARVLLEGLAQAWDPGLPHVDHVVTFATPHRGAALAELAADLDDATAAGRWVVDGVAAWAERGGPLPDPRAPSVRQLAPDSPLMAWLATEDVTFGTRVLSLASAGDVIVPAPRSSLAGARNHVLAPAGWNAHAALVRSAAARSHAYAFLRDAAAACRGAWDSAGAGAGALIDFAERHAGDVLGALEPAGAAPAARAVRWVAERTAETMRSVGRALTWMWRGIGRIGTGAAALGAQGLRSLRDLAPHGVSG